MMRHFMGPGTAMRQFLGALLFGVVIYLVGYPLHRGLYIGWLQNDGSTIRLCRYLMIGEIKAMGISPGDECQWFLREPTSK